MAARCSRRTACALLVMCGAWPAQAEQEQIGVQKAGCDCKIFQVPETLPADGSPPHTPERGLPRTSCPRSRVSARILLSTLGPHAPLDARSRACRESSSMLLATEAVPTEWQHAWSVVRAPTCSAH